MNQPPAAAPSPGGPPSADRSLLTALGVLLGALIGHNAGVIAQFLERLFRFEIFSSEVYTVTRIPSELHGTQILWIAGIAMFITLLATIYPAFRASRIPPADALRYE